MANRTFIEPLHEMFGRFLGAYSGKPGEIAATYTQLTQLFLMMAAVNFNRAGNWDGLEPDAGQRAMLKRIFTDVMEQQKSLHFLITRGISALNFLAAGPLTGPSLDLGCADGYSSFLIFDEPFTYGVKDTGRRSNATAATAIIAWDRRTPFRCPMPASRPS